MSFLNSILLAGAAAFTIPLIIHLLNRRRVHTIQWGAMHLLQQALNLRRRNLNVEQKLLLLTRIAIPIILALCLARPVFNLVRQLPGFNKTSLIVLLDDSASMRAPGNSSENIGNSPRDQAIATLQRIISDLPQGSDVSVILAGSPPRLLLDSPTTDHNLIFDKLNTTSSLAGPIDLTQTLQLATSQIPRTLTPAREIILISDFQHSDWQPLLDGAALSELDALKQTQPPPAFAFYHINNQNHENLALSQVDTSAFIVARDQPIALRATIQNHGQRDYHDLPLHLEADGVRIRSTRASIPPGTSTTLTLAHSFNSPGDHTLTLRLEGDAFPEDNTFSLIIPVREKIPTLLVKGRSGSAPLSGPTDFLEIALSPHQNISTNATFKDVIHPTVIEETKFNERALLDQQIVILANVERLNGNQLKHLRQHIEQGAHLIIFPGPDIDLNWYDKELYLQAKGLLPARPIGFGHLDNHSPPARLINQLHTHPATLYFNEARGMSLRDITITHWQKYHDLPDDTRVLLSLENGDPFLLEKTYGKGTVLLFSTTATAQWSNLPLQPVFVPLMQRLITHLATKNTPAPYHLSGSELQYNLTENQAAQPLHIIDPLNQPHPLTINLPQKLNTSKKDTPTLSSPNIQYQQTFLPGIYQLREANHPENPPLKQFAFNPDPAESNLQTLSPEQVQTISERLDATYANDYNDYQKHDRQRRFGAEIWQPLLFLVLALLFGEVFLQQRIARA